MSQFINLFNMGRHTPYVWSSVTICFIVYFSLLLYNKYKRQYIFKSIIKEEQRKQRIINANQENKDIL